MPTKVTNITTPPKRFTVSGKTFTWTTDDGDTITIPLRIKLKVIRQIAGDNMTPDVMFTIIEQIAPGQAEVLDEMDVNDFTSCFAAWQVEYNALTGATPGE